MEGKYSNRNCSEEIKLRIDKYIKDGFFKFAFLHAYILFMENEILCWRYSHNGDLAPVDYKNETSDIYNNIHGRCKIIEDFKKDRDDIAHGNRDIILGQIDWESKLNDFLVFVFEYTGEGYGESYWFLD